jgi:hypothetical protein
VSSPSAGVIFESSRTIRYGLASTAIPTGLGIVAVRLKAVRRRGSAASHSRGSGQSARFGPDAKLPGCSPRPQWSRGSGGRRACPGNPWNVRHPETSAARANQAAERYPVSSKDRCAVLRLAEMFDSCTVGAQWCSPLRRIHHPSVCGAPVRCRIGRSDHRRRRQCEANKRQTSAFYH